MGESLPQADTHRQTEGTRGEAEEARSAPMPSWHQSPGASLRRENGSARVRPIACFVSDRALPDSVSVTFGRVALVESLGPTVGARSSGRGEASRLWAYSRPRDPAHRTSGDGNSVTGLSAGTARDDYDGDRWGGVPQCHPDSSREDRDRPVGGKVTVSGGEVNGESSASAVSLARPRNARFMNGLGSRCRSRMRASSPRRAENAGRIRALHTNPNWPLHQELIATSGEGEETAKKKPNEREK
jgi:hypothetical protein